MGAHGKPPAQRIREARSARSTALANAAIIRLGLADSDPWREQRELEDRYREQLRWEDEERRLSTWYAKQRRDAEAARPMLGNYFMPTAEDWARTISTGLITSHAI